MNILSEISYLHVLTNKNSIFIRPVLYLMSIFKAPCFELTLENPCEFEFLSKKPHVSRYYYCRLVSV